jgi:hypothetical protein
MTPSGITPMNFQFVAQCLNQLHHQVPQENISWLVNGAPKATVILNALLCIKVQASV